MQRFWGLQQLTRVAVVSLLATLVLSASQQETRTFAGVIADDACAKGDHSHMRMGSNDADCTLACVDAHRAAFVLYDGKTSYTLAGNKALQKFAAQKVRIVGVLDSKTQTIRVDSITAAK